MGFRLRLARATLRSWQRRERWWVMSDHRVTVFDEHDNVVDLAYTKVAPIC